MSMRLCTVEESSTDLSQALVPPPTPPPPGGLLLLRRPPAVDLSSPDQSSAYRRHREEPPPAAAWRLASDVNKKLRLRSMRISAQLFVCVLGTTLIATSHLAREPLSAQLGRAFVGGAGKNPYPRIAALQIIATAAAAAA